MKKIFAISLALAILIIPGIALAACECVCSFADCPGDTPTFTWTDSVADQAACDALCASVDPGCGSLSTDCRSAGTLPGTDTGTTTDSDAGTTTGGGSDLRFEPPLGTTSIQEIIGRVIQAVLGIVGSIALLMLVIGGFVWMTAAGSAERVKLGKDIIIWSVIGLAVIFAAYAITRFVITALLQ